MYPLCRSCPVNQPLSSARETGQGLQTNKRISSTCTTPPDSRWTSTTHVEKAGERRPEALKSRPCGIRSVPNLATNPVEAKRSWGQGGRLGLRLAMHGATCRAREESKARLSTYPQRQTAINELRSMRKPFKRLSQHGPRAVWELRNGDRSKVRLE